MTRIFYIIEQEVIMAELIGFSENCRTSRPTYMVRNLRELRPDATPDGSYTMIHCGPLWGIGYQKEIRYFLDDGTHVDFIDDLDGQVQFLKDYIANDGNTPTSQKLELASEVEFMDI